MKILLGKSEVALRKCKGNSRSLNAGRLKSEGAVERLIHLDEGFQFLRALIEGHLHISRTGMKNAG